MSVLAEYVCFRKACLFIRRVCLQGVFVYKACLFTRRAYLSFAKHTKARGIARSARFSTLCSLTSADYADRAVPRALARLAKSR